MQQNGVEVVTSKSLVPVEPLIKFKDFLLCSISLESTQFINYMREAYILFFNNSDQSIGGSEFFHLLKDDKYVSSKNLKSVID